MCRHFPRSPWRAGVRPISTHRTLELITHSPAQTCQLGWLLGRLLRPGDVVCLQGELGSGKTCLARGVGSGLGVSGVVRSPSFVLINEHPSTGSGPRFYHVDLYRIRGVADALALGLEEYLYGDGVTVIEWAERARKVIPSERLWITLSHLGLARRSLVLEAWGAHYLEMLTTLKDSPFAHKVQGDE